MSGGDLHVRSNSAYFGQLGGASLRDTIDANSVPSGNMTETVPGVSFDGKPVYFTPEGAARMRELMSMDARIEVHSDTKPGLLWGTKDNLDGRTERFVGTP